MLIQNFSQQPCNSQADSNYESYSDSENAILKHTHLIIDKSFAIFKSRTFYLEKDLEKILDLIKKLNALTSVEDIMVTIRGEISLLNKQLITTQTNLQQCVQELNLARNYQQQIREPSPIFKGALSFFMLWLSVLIVKESYFNGEISPIKLGTVGSSLMLMNVYLLFHELVDLRVNKRFCERNSLERNKRQLTQQSEYLISLEAQLSELSEKVAKPDEPTKISQIGNCIQREKAFARPTSISGYLLSKEKSIESIASQVDEEPLCSRKIRPSHHRVPEIRSHDAIESRPLGI